MSEVKRWKLKGFLPGVEGECKAVFQPTVVMAEDFDNATLLFLDAAERCIASERREKELQRRLTAADERWDGAVNLLEVWRTWLGPTRESCDETGKNIWDRIDAVTAPKPAGGSSDA